MSCLKKRITFSEKAKTVKNVRLELLATDLFKVFHWFLVAKLAQCNMLTAVHSGGAPDLSYMSVSGLSSQLIHPTPQLPCLPRFYSKCHNWSSDLPPGLQICLQPGQAEPVSQVDHRAKLCSLVPNSRLRLMYLWICIQVWLRHTYNHNASAAKSLVNNFSRLFRY